MAAYYPYEWKLMDFAKSGEQIAYYFRGEPLSERSGSLLQFAYKEQRITDYSAYPRYPTKAELDSSPFYRQTLSELIDEAKQDQKRNLLFMKAVPWTEAVGVQAKYTRQGAFIDLSATLLHGGEVQVYQEPGNKPEKLKVEGGI
ncbi:hypothetical protein [Paenibacillus riograndensis]|uniref:Uncharacterized protein n=1 Tax=Paenibacillus riograndensis SBR5 TaxID=1073571 RepID=A0A0E4H6E2_9BACL|nr:hypothetical protein [Paenibacillus riograndensis]CQR51809.1 hypothetical protein PRIO_0496 [Paenibacillus riograndensis SBR5]